MKRKVCLIVEILTAALVLFAWCWMILDAADGGAFSLAGLENVKFFTVQSNLLAGAASLICAVFLLIKKEPPAWVLRLRLAAASAVALTFLTVLLFLGPVFGFGIMYIRANLFFHLLIPLLSAVGWALMPIKRVPLAAALWALLPPILYGTWYCVNVALNGADACDWYGFFLWGTAPACGIIAALGGAVFGAAAVLRMTNGK